MDIFSKLKEVHDKWEDIGRMLTEPDISSDMKRYVALNKEYKELQSVTEAYLEYSSVLSNIENAKNILQTEKDDEFREMAKAELDELYLKKEQMEEDIKILLLPSDPQDKKNCIIEIRGGTGGDEASLFAGDLFRMYTRYLENRKWKYDVVDFTEGTMGGYKEVIINVTAESAYGTLKFESGVHRVQRVPETEAQGRIHTSAATVAILPEADEVDVEVKESDIRKDTFCSSGAGGQSVNTTYSAIRLTHIPTGIVVQCQDERSQIKNYDKALKVLRSRIFEIEHQKYLDNIASQRKTLVSSGDRSAKIRTYNYPQSRVTDHRIGMTVYNLPSVMNGDIQQFIDSLQIAENTERLKEGVNI
ncbi:MAG: peptide chain release factor 1 [Bacteroidetes bacterium GWF2_43_63]|nr:MAG: peptide chain release factor 1 [Bacteroidetes bacterium GWE2_42_42]OFY55886.1 MAG: peptide chain release factor 1 [Bacteroidetes bacterium GWF2_43_63]